MKKIFTAVLFLILMVIIIACGLMSCTKSYNVQYKVTYMNGDTEILNENWNLHGSPEPYLDKGCVKMCAGCIPSACQVRRVELISATKN